MLEINYKKKYLELRAKYISDLDMAFRLGMEQGQQQAQQQQALEAQAQAQEMEQQQKLAEASGMGGEQPGQPGQPGQEGGQPPQAGQEESMGQETEAQANPGMEPNGGSELDQHISKLEGMLGGSKAQGPEQQEIKKSLEAIKSLRKAEKFSSDMKKSDMAIKGIAKALHKPAFKVGVQAQHNMTDNAKKAVTLQHKIVNDIMKAWKSEETKASHDIKSILNIENLTKE